MVDRHKKKIKIGPSHCDSTGKLGVPQTADLFMDMAAEHSDLLGIGQNVLGKDGGFWMTVKNMMRFYRKPDFSEEALLSTWPEAPGRRACLRDYTLTGEDGILAAGKTEWAVFDFGAGRLRRVDDIYPEGLNISDDVSMPDSFQRFEDEISDGDVLGSYTVRSTDIDLGGHMNNVAYLRALESLFPSKEWREMDIRFIETWYRAQCFEGETLTARWRQHSDRCECSLFKDDGTCAAQIRFVTAAQESVQS